jgi:hypothetical protein
MVFSGFVLKCLEENVSQMLLPSIRWKDLFGTNKLIQHNHLFDVVHWNSFYPKLPRFVRFDPDLYTDLHFDQQNRIQWRPGVLHPVNNATKPLAFPKRQNQMFFLYRRYTKSLFQNPQPNPAHTLMLQGAWRPHPALREIIGMILKTIFQGEGDTFNFLALHARVEPDMQKHPVCRDKKVLKLQDIFEMLHSTFKDPPTSKVLIMLNRELLEREGKDAEIAAENLRLLNQAVQEGLWGGRVKVFEAGSTILENSTFGQLAPSIGGSIVDFFLAVEAAIFVGTEVSSFSTGIQTTRFARNKLKNYKYVPEGLVQTTTEDTKAPPAFLC